MVPQPDWLAAAAATKPAAPFVTTPARSWTFADVDAAAGQLAGAVREAGAGPNAVVALWATNEIETIEAMFAIPRAGATVLLLNTRLAPSEVSDQLRRAGAVLAVATEPAETHGLDGFPVLDASARGEAIAGRLPHPDHEAVIAFTSGTAGRPRGVVLTHANLAAATMASAQHLAHTPEDRWLAVLPLFHVGGASILWRSARQASEVLLLSRFEPNAVAAGLHEVTLASLVGTMLPPILASDPGPYRGLRGVLIGGGPADPGVLEQAESAGIPVLSTYGMTETASQIATAPLGDGPRRRVVPVPGAEIRVAADGELEVRGPMVAHRFLGEPPRRGWFPTGDLGSIDDAGYLRVTGRKRDLIISGGENVAPEEVEAALLDTEGVREAVVVGVADPTWGEAVAAVLVTNRRPAEIEARLRNRLAGYKIPRRWAVVDALPRTDLGKLDRTAIQRLAGSGDG